MMRFWVRFAALSSVLTATLAGCGGFGVYESEFSCPNSYNGRCVSVSSAYELAHKGQDGPEYDPAVQKEKGAKSPEEKGEKKDKQPAASGEEAAHVSYKESLFKRFDGLLREPATPVVAPPQVMRVLLLPYKGEGNELFMLRHVYFFVDEPRWVLGDSLLAIDEEE